MRNISFFLTQEQIRKQTKTVTRRQGWLKLKVGDVLQPIEKGQGLKRGEKVQKIGPPIRVTEVGRVQLDTITENDVILEGLDMTPTTFVVFYCQHNKCLPSSFVTRIEFEYLNDHE